MSLDNTIGAGFGLATGALLSATALNVIGRTTNYISNPRKRKRNKRGIRLL